MVPVSTNSTRVLYKTREQAECNDTPVIKLSSLILREE